MSTTVEQDQTRIAALVAECASIASGLDQQAISAQSGTALGGHPSPAYFYGQAASMLRAAGELILRQEERIRELEANQVRHTGVDPATAGTDTTVSVEVSPAGAAVVPPPDQPEVSPKPSRPRNNR